MPFRVISAEKKDNWMKLAQIFRGLLGGRDDLRMASEYLEQLANNTFPVAGLLPLPWHESRPPADVIPEAWCAPHECVVAVLCPSVPLRVVWKQRRR